MDYTQVILKPVVTEKATLIKDECNQAAFLVSSRSNKIEIKKAVETAFKVKVLDVRVTVRKPGLKTRHGRVTGRVAGFKKAYVTLAKGDKIEFFEGV
ncbi:MAG: 50S ribosomal protein L23 [Deltaproteobacteria bacterium]|jgi:large subunit ribosomal protein L23|nr:50S ribosomal protein L23 [Deltaproteobacteria bacterium]